MSIRWVVVVAAIAACSKKDPEPAGNASSGGTGSAPKQAPPAQVDAAPAVAAATEEAWAATLVMTADMRDLVVHFAKKGDAWTATADIAAIKKTGLPLTDVTYAPDKIAFKLGKHEVYELARTGDTATGSGKVGDLDMPIRMAKLAPGEAPHSTYPRPQTPKPPFPYAARDVEIDAPDGSKLAGTLTVPEGAGPFPAVLLISGSGQQDRDETIFRHKPYLILADKLTRAGFATLRYDDRQAPGGKTTGKAGTLDTEIADDSACVAWLEKQQEVDAKRIGLVGHSTGGMVAPNVAVKTKKIAFLVSLAGVAVTGRELVPLQIEMAARIHGAPEDTIKQLVETQKKIGEAAVKDPASVKPILAELAKKEGVKPEDIERLIAKPAADATQPWTLSFFRIDPREAWKQLNVPVLLVVGDKDTQVPADITIKTLEESLSPEAKKLSTTKKIPGINHLFQHAKTGLPEEYAENEESFDPATLEVVVTWLADHAKK